MSSDPEPIKTVEVEPVEEGVRVKPKRQMTEAQLLILQKGREKLAEKRKAAKEQKEAEEAAQKKEVDSVIEADKDGVVEAIDMDEVEEEQGVVPLCSIT
jgi:hypothetical protein